MVALTTLNLPAEAWKSARLLRAVPKCRLVLLLAYHMLSPALSVEETGLMAYLQTPPEAGPSIVQVTSGLQNWKCAGRRLVEIGGRLPTATQLHQSFIKMLSKHLQANKKVNFVFQQQSSCEHYIYDEPKSNGDCGTLFVCGSHSDPVCYSCRTLPRSGCIVSKAKVKEGKQSGSGP